MKNEYDIKNILTKAEERDLIKKAQMGNQAAITKLIFKNHGLILKLANRYLRESLKLDDLINEGRLGVYQAILNFDLETNYKFSTYAFWWIRCYISEFVRLECRNIVIPSVKYAELSNLKKIRSELAQILKQEPSKLELADSLKITIKELEQLLILENDTVSLNYLTSDTEDSAELKEFINDDELEIPEIVIEDNFQEEIFRILKNTNLTDKQINIFLLRCSGKTLAQISSLYGVRKESIRQMETKIKRVLKNDSYIQELCSYYPEYRKYKKKH